MVGNSSSSHPAHDPAGHRAGKRTQPSSCGGGAQAVLLCVEGWLVEGARCEVACAWVAAVNVGALGAV